MATPNPIGSHNVSSYLNLRHTSGQYDTAIMFVGAAGVGKSTLCNFLSRSDVFETFDTPKSLTKKAKSHIFPAEGKECLIIDTPGFHDSKEQNETEVLSEICRAGVMAKDGVDAFAFVINLTERFPEARLKNAMMTFNAICSNFWNYTFIIFTHEEDMMSQAGSTKEFIQANLKNPACSKLLLQTFRNVKCSHMCIESVTMASNNEYWEIKCKELFDHIETIKNETGQVRFDSVLMSRGKELYARCLRLDAENEKLTERNKKLELHVENYKNDMRNRMQLPAIENANPEADAALATFLGIAIGSIATILGISLLKLLK